MFFCFFTRMLKCKHQQRPYTKLRLVTYDPDYVSHVSVPNINIHNNPVSRASIYMHYKPRIGEDFGLLEVWTSPL